MKAAAIDTPLGLRRRAFPPMVWTAAVSAYLRGFPAAVTQVAPTLAFPALARPGEVPAGVEQEGLDADSLVDQVIRGLFAIQEDHPAAAFAS